MIPRPTHIAADPDGVVGQTSRNTVYRRLLAKARACAATDHALLLVGEPGSGKGKLAEQVHLASPRAQRPLLWASAPDLLDLLQAGDGGAQSDASATLRDHLLRVRAGTLAVHRMEDLELPAQARLLRALRQLAGQLDGSFAPTGSGFRILATLSCSLATEVRKGAFRADIYHRLGLQLLHVPPLRERREDIEPLALAVLQRERGPHGCNIDRIDGEALRTLLDYDFPHNVSELEAIVALAAKHAHGPVLRARCLPSHVRTPGVPVESDEAPQPAWRTLEEIQADHVRRVLTHTRGNRSEAARILGISRTGLLCKIRRYGIDVPPGDEGGRHQR